MAEPSSGRSDEYFATISQFNSCSLTGYNEIEHPTDIIDYPNYLPNYDHDVHTEAFGPIFSIGS